jgi:hypothetical protein
VTGRALLLTGGVATGKTIVAKELVAIASTLGLRAAAIDLDWLGWATGATLGLDDLIARNLSAVAGSYAAAGIDHLALARAVVHQGGLQVVAGALTGWDLTVIRLAAPRAALEQRIRARDSGSELREHLSELDEMTEQVSAAAPGAHVVVNDGRDLEDVANEVMRLAGWML